MSAVFGPWAMTAAPGAVAEPASPAIGHRPAAKKSAAGSRPSTAQVVGTAVSHVGGSTIAVSRAG